MMLSTNFLLLFTVSPNHHAAEYDRVTNFYGANAVYDLVYSLSSMELYLNPKSNTIILFLTGIIWIASVH